MQYVVEAVPLLLLAGIVALILASLPRGRSARRRPARSPRPKKSTLRVSSSQMDDDLQELIRKS